MARRSSRIEEMREKNEVSSCMWGLFSILESCQGRPSHKMISNGRPENRQIIDYPRKLLDPVASFDEECRKIHNRAGVRSVLVDAKGMSIEKHKSKQYAKKDVERLDCLMRTHKRTRSSSQDAYQSSSCCLNNAARLMAELPSTSAEMSLNKLTLAAILGAVCAQNHHKETKLSEYLQRNNYLDQVDQSNIQQVQMRAKAFVDQMFINRKLALKEGRSSDSKSFSDALDVLNSKRNLFMELLPNPNSMLARRVKKLSLPQTEKDTIKSVLATNTSECEEGLDATTSAKSETALANQTSDKIVILKPAPRNAKKVTCNCSSLQFATKSSRRVSEMKTASFSFREIKKKLKHTFGVTKKDRSQLLCISTPGVGSECICDGVEIRNSFSSSTSAEKKEKLKSTRGSDIGCVDDTSRRKLDVPSARYSNKEEFDVILEAKRHLFTRLSSLNSVEAVTSNKPPRTLERILSSPEHELWPFSPRRDSLYFSGAAEMRFSPNYNTSPRVTVSSSHARNESRSNTEIASCHDQSKSLLTADAKACSMILRTEAEAEADNMKTNGESKAVQMKSFPPPESRVSGETLSGTISTRITKPLETTDIIKANKCDGITMDSFTENEAATYTLDEKYIKYQEEHRSPVSVLEPFFIEDANSPPTITLQTGQFSAIKQLQPRRLDFEDSSFESLPQYQEEEEEEEEYHLCQYVQSVIEASCLNWDHLSEITTPPEELLLLHESLFDEVELPSLDFCYDPKLLFDHINEVLTEIYKRQFCSPPWLQVSATPKTRPAEPPLAELVVDEILAEAEFFLLATTERRTLEQIVSKDVVNCRWWLDVRLDMEHIVVEISEAVLEESLLEFNT
ncbi:hypothetical protein C2S52_008254 [Perilla frutescens var. hirtella]|nr:hypothetical protein C2S52_008254 [Perilla frutescens var. hirtella]